MLRYTDVYKAYKASDFSLSDINFSIKEGEFVFMIGKTGAGKTSIIKMAYGQVKPDSGSVFLLGCEISSIKERQKQKLRRKIGLVFQEDNLIGDKTVYENVAYPLYISGVDKLTVKKRVSIALRLVALTHRAEAYPPQLSGGEKQKASIARAFVKDPALIIADEPTGNIDKKASHEIMDIIQKINRMGTAVLIATHDLDIVDKYCSRMIEIGGGRIIRDEVRGACR